MRSPPRSASDPYLSRWRNSPPATFDGGLNYSCMFPGRIWKSKRESAPRRWNMLCSRGYNGVGPWVKFTSADPSLARWGDSNETFVRGATPGGFSNAALFHRIPNAPAAGPTHLINDGTGEQYLLGTYDEQEEVLTVTSKPQRLDCSNTDNFRWVATGKNGPDPATDSGRLLIMAWVYGPPAPSTMSLVRDISWDAAARMLVSYPVPEYERLRTTAYIEHERVAIAAGQMETMRLPADGAGGAVDIFASFELSGSSTGGFGLAVRAPPTKYAGVAAVTMTVDAVGAADASGARSVSLSFVTPDPKADHDSNGNATVVVLRGETLDVRVLVDKPIVEFFIMGGRAAYVAIDEFYTPAAASAHLFNAGAHPVVASNVSAYGVGCGWSHTLPVPVDQVQRPMLM